MFRRTVQKPIDYHSKSYQTIKIAIDSNKLNNTKRKNKYQMQSIDHLRDNIATKISEIKNKNAKHWPP